ncbi:hypothetical protein [Modestobacter versicolor]|uniref:hypothetical protein n=1 Tax=Modestobacter versicolor TaxID=429133 RepID=UPI0034DF0FAB
MSRNQRRKKRNKPSGSQQANRSASRADTRAPAPAAVLHRSSTETKSASRTTEFIAYAAAVLAVVITALAVDADGRGGADPFGAETALRYLALLTIGYVVARGLAKSGSHEGDVQGHVEGHVEGHVDSHVDGQDDGQDEHVEHDADDTARTRVAHDRGDDHQHEDHAQRDQHDGEHDGEAATVPPERDQRPADEGVDGRP